MSKRDNAIRTMNSLGGAGRPFLFVIDFEMDEPHVLAPENAVADGFLYDFNRVTNSAVENSGSKPSFFDRFPIPSAEYLIGYNRVLKALRRGDSYLVNFTSPTRIETDLDLREIFHCASAKYRLLCADRWICFSPETFVRIESGVISSFPMKGTIDAESEGAEEKILSDPKELAEHTTIVDLIRNDLNIVATDVEVERFRYIERLRTNQGDLLQVSSKITGRLPRDYRERIGSIIFSMLPAGSVSGAPKKRTVEIIQDAEARKRGFYTGVAGFFDGMNLDSCVLIRFIEKTPEGLLYRSGGGITVNSNPESEYREMIDKVYVPLI